MNTKIIYHWICIILCISLLTSCEDYLERTPEAEISEKEMFGSFESFMSYTDANYSDIMDKDFNYYGHPPYWGGESLNSGRDHGTFRANRGNYRPLLTGAYSYYSNPNREQYGVEGDSPKNSGIWLQGWKGIRRCNITFKNLPLLVASDEQKNIIEGQAYFFRAWFHQQIIEAFGGMPYIDKVFDPSETLREPRLLYQETAERVIEDLDQAISLLPVNWNETVLHKHGTDRNIGRVTKGAAIALKGRFLLYAGSPLMNGFSGNDYTYNIEYCKRSAEASWEVIKMAQEDGIYSLVPFEKYSENFHNNNNGNGVWSSETIWLKVIPLYEARGKYSWWCQKSSYLPTYLGGRADHQTATQNFVDRFEMADGTRYKPEYDNDDNKRWKNRDPRFHYNFYVDRDKLGDHPNSVYHGHIDSENQFARPSNGSLSPYLIKKYFGKNVNIFDGGWNNYLYRTPIIRLAEVYLNYAEAVTAAYGPTGSAPGANLTAVEAINIIRSRAGMPPVTAQAEGYNSFMELLRNERSVELAYEGQYWFDLRRWYIAHLPENKVLYTLNFDKDWNYFNREVLLTRVFDDPKHYWLPIYREQAQLYPEFHQNPGW